MLARSLGRRLFSTSIFRAAAEPPQNKEGSDRTNFPYRNPWKVLKSEFQEDADELVPRETDILVVGGGIMGLSVAYWLRKTGNLTVTVLERDSSYTQAATPLSVGGIRQQFSEPENIQMSLFTAEFIRHIQEHLSVLDQDPPDIQFSPHGYLTLAAESGAEQLQMNYNIQKEHGADVELLSRGQLKERWPWMNVEDISLACYGISNEGWFDPWLLLSALRRKIISLGVTIVHGELTGFEKSSEGMNMAQSSSSEERFRLTAAKVRVAGKEEHEVKFASVVNAAGPWAQNVAKMAGIGLEGYAGGPDLPVERRLRSHFVVRCPPSGPKAPGIDTPWIRDTSGINVRRKDLAGHFIVFHDDPVHSAGEEPKDVETLDVDYSFFEEKIWPALAHRIPPMEAVKIRSAWAGFYDFNTEDQNLIIGNHPYHRNFIFCNGSSGHGIQHSLAIGRAVTELIVFSEYKTIDLSRLAYDRFMTDELVFEKNII